jgi:hypothetical protein
MADYVKESLHNLQSGSYHPSRECFMADIVDDPHHDATPEGHVASANNGTSHGGGGMRLPRILLTGMGLWRAQRSHPTHV